MRVRIKTKYPDLDLAIRDISQAIDTLFKGNGDNVGSVTLMLSSTTTVVTDARVGATSVITLSPTNAAGATELANIYVSTTNGQFTLTHTNAGTTRTFGYVING